MVSRLCVPGEFPHEEYNNQRNVMADDVELAKVYARSIYDEFSWVEMVIIPRDSIVTVIES